MISTIEDLLNLIINTYENPVIINNGNYVSVVKGQEGCEFHFKDYAKTDLNPFYAGHHCLSFDYYDGHCFGEFYTQIADTKDLTNEVIDFIDSNMKLTKRTTISIFDFKW